VCEAFLVKDIHTGKQEWTKHVIADALNVSQWTINQDLRDLEVTSKSPRPKTASSPRGSGRKRAAAASAKRPRPSFN
jgi:hypothetical protein